MFVVTFFFFVNWTKKLSLNQVFFVEYYLFVYLLDYHHCFPSYVEDFVSHTNVLR
jgi:hypothetical protein